MQLSLISMQTPFPTFLAHMVFPASLPSYLFLVGNRARRPALRRLSYSQAPTDGNTI